MLSSASQTKISFYLEIISRVAANYIFEKIKIVTDLSVGNSTKLVLELKIHTR